MNTRKEFSIYVKEFSFFSPFQLAVPIISFFFFRRLHLFKTAPRNLTQRNIFQLEEIIAHGVISIPCQDWPIDRRRCAIWNPYRRGTRGGPVLLKNPPSSFLLQFFTKYRVEMSGVCCLDSGNGCSGSLRLRNGNVCPGSGRSPLVSCKTSEMRSCTSVMSPETKRLLPPNTETVQTKPFPIRGKSWGPFIFTYVLVFARDLCVILVILLLIQLLNSKEKHQ